jgi:type VI secretion system secreted protein Hcp
MAIYLKLGDIKGEVTAQGFADQIECHSMQFGVGRAISTPVGAVTNREASAPSISEVVLTKQLDKSSIALFTEAVVGKKEKALKAEITKTGGDSLEKIAVYTLHNTMISGYSVSSGGDRPSESISLNFTKIEIEVVNETETGEDGSPVRASYDLATAKA